MFKDISNLLHATHENIHVILLLDINECSTNNGGCSVNAQCTNIIGGNRTCTCNSGYTGDGFTCTGKLITFLSLRMSSFDFTLSLNEK